MNSTHYDTCRSFEWLRITEANFREGDRYWDLESYGELVLLSRYKVEPHYACWSTKDPCFHYGSDGFELIRRHIPSFGRKLSRKLALALANRATDEDEPDVWDLKAHEEYLQREGGAFRWIDPDQEKPWRGHRTRRACQVRERTGLFEIVGTDRVKAPWQEEPVSPFAASDWMDDDELEFSSWVVTWEPDEVRAEANSTPVEAHHEG